MLNRLLPCAVLIVFLTGCAYQPKIQADFDTSFSFNQTSDYAWAPNSGGDDEFLSLFGQRVERAITSNLEGKNKQLVKKIDDADFLVAYHLIIDKQLRVDQYYNNWGYRPFWWSHPINTTSSTRVREYKTGTLVIDLIDPKSKTVFFSGSAESRLKSSQTPQERESRINESVQLILAQVPG